MEHSEEKVVNKTVKKYTCDICGIPCRHVHCHKCGRDICPEHLLYYSEDELEKDASKINYCWPSSKSSKICTECWAKGREVRQEIIERKVMHRKDIDNLLKKWNDLCTGNKEDS